MRSAADHGRGRRELEAEPGRRLFIAVPVGEEVSARVADLVARLVAPNHGGGSPPDGVSTVGGEARPRIERQPGGVRWVRLDGLHLTVRFLGVTSDDRLDELREAVSAAADEVGPFRLGIQGGGAFPSVDRPRVLWLGVADPTAGFGALSEAVARHLQRAGWPADDRPATPHLTLARTDGVRGASRVARRLIAAARSLDAWFNVREVILFESHTGGGPARYEPLHVVSLSGPPSRLPVPVVGQIAEDQPER